MDSERQALLRADDHPDIRYRSIRPLTPDEVASFRNQPTWRRARFVICFMFWALSAMLVSLIACLVMEATRCDKMDYKQVSSVAPVHMTLATLAWRAGDDAHMS